MCYSIIMPTEIPSDNPIEPKGAGQQPGDGENNTPPKTPQVFPESYVPPSIKNKCYSKCSLKEFREWGKVILEAATLIAVVWYACIASNQLTAMHKSNRINHDALVATQRAYISVTGLNIRHSQFNPKLVSYTVSPIVVNSGNTPTKNLWWTAVFGTNPVTVDQEPTSEDLTSAAHNYGTLGARQEVRDLIQQPIPTEDAAILRQSYARKHIPIYGAIVYEDGISDPPVIHVRRYCYSLYVNPYFTDPKGFSYTMCGGRSNCEDEECDQATQQQMAKIRAAKRN